MTSVRLLTESEIRGLVGPAEALAAMRPAFVALAAGAVTLPAAMDFEFPDLGGEAHIKGAHLHGQPQWAVKAASGFASNRLTGLPPTSGLFLVFSARTGGPEAVLFDNGYLTELRTGAAGALAADLLARQEINRVAVIGAGGQARFQLEALVQVRSPRQVVIANRTSAAAHQLADELRGKQSWTVEVADDVREAVTDADLVITTTASRTPLLEAGWLTPGAHLTAMGSDFPHKQEIAVEVIAEADVVVADNPASAAANGEIHHALAAGLLALDQVVPLGAIVSGSAAGRTGEDQITVCDLVGVGAQDAAIASEVVRLAEARGVGERFSR